MDCPGAVGTKNAPAKAGAPNRLANLLFYGHHHSGKIIFVVAGRIGVKSVVFADIGQNSQLDILCLSRGNVPGIDLKLIDDERVCRATCVYDSDDRTIPGIFAESLGHKTRIIDIDRFLGHYRLGEVGWLLVLDLGLGRCNLLLALRQLLGADLAHRIVFDQSYPKHYPDQVQSCQG